MQERKEHPGCSGWLISWLNSNLKTFSCNHPNVEKVWPANLSGDAAQGALIFPQQTRHLCSTKQLGWNGWEACVLRTEHAIMYANLLLASPAVLVEAESQVTTDRYILFIQKRKKKKGQVALCPNFGRTVGLILAAFAHVSTCALGRDSM